MSNRSDCMCAAGVFAALFSFRLRCLQSSGMVTIYLVLFLVRLLCILVCVRVLDTLLPVL